MRPEYTKQEALRVELDLSDDDLDYDFSELHNRIINHSRNDSTQVLELDGKGPTLRELFGDLFKHLESKQR
jgi:hypothetical protein